MNVKETIVMAVPVVTIVVFVFLLIEKHVYQELKITSHHMNRIYKPRNHLQTIIYHILFHITYFHDIFNEASCFLEHTRTSYP